MKKRTLLIIVSAIVIVILAVVIFTAFGKKENKYAFNTATVEKGNINNTVTATGTVQALKTVDVGTQVSGVIQKIYVDFNSHVKKGELLAQLDETPLLASLEQSKASVDAADAQLQYQKANYERLKTLYEKKLIAQSDFDQATYNYNSAKASLSNAKSVYDKNRINLNYASIYSPIDGVVLNRAVDEGQTVAASFNTPTLFSIANDLTQMQVEASVDEADIGSVKDGQRVEFTVDAYPDQKFNGKVSEVRLEPVVTSNVVTYTVIINAPNPEKKLMPGMTASTTIYVEEKDNILTIPGQALRFTPTMDEIAYIMKSSGAEFPGRRNFQGRSGNFSGGQGQGFQGRQGSNNQSATGQGSANRQGFTGGSFGQGGMFPGNGNGTQPTRVWIKKGDTIHPARIVTGIDDGTTYEVKSGLKEGDEVILSMTKDGKGSSNSTTKSTATSPFMPQRRGR